MGFRETALSFHVSGYVELLATYLNSFGQTDAVVICAAFIFRKTDQRPHFGINGPTNQRRR